jgi:hypothetical protein
MRAMMLIAAAVLSGCTAPRPGVWQRVDGKPVNMQQYEVDFTICKGEASKADLSRGSGDGYDATSRIINVALGCMAQRGYVWRQQ